METELMFDEEPFGDVLVIVTWKTWFWVPAVTLDGDTVNE
jgi:hypothetical protein